MADLADLTAVLSNTTNVTIVLDSFVNYLDNIMRVVSVLIHLVYIGFVVYLKDFRIRQMMYLHHVNMIGFIYCLHYTCYISSQAPTFDSPELNDVLCFISSMVWMVTKFLRMYSLLLLAFYRYVAVFHLTFHRKLTKNLFHMILAVVIFWVFSLIFALILKYSYNTSYSVFYCFEGDSDDLNVVISFLIVNNFFAIVVPSLLVVFVYIRIMIKVKKLTSKLSSQTATKSVNKVNAVNVLKQSKKERSSQTGKNTSQLTSTIQSTLPSTIFTSSNNLSNSNASSTGSNMATRRSKQANMALQLILMNGVNLIGSAFSIIINARLKVATSNDNLGLISESQYSRPMFRFIFLLTQSLIPVLSIVLSPWKK